VKAEERILNELGRRPFAGLGGVCRFHMAIDCSIESVLSRSDDIDEPYLL
jgi:hypothetical protein